MIDIAAQTPTRLGVVASMVESIASSRLLSIALLLFVSIAALAPGFATMPPMDRDEPRFAQATKQMLETGDFVNIRFQDDARLNKPVGIYWLQAAAVSAAEALGLPDARTTIGVYRVPSLLAALLAVVLTWWTALALARPRAALLAGLMMAGTILLGVEARLAKTDATLLAATLAMIGAAAHIRSNWVRGVERPGWALPGLFWVAAAISILVKGPIGPLVVGLAVVGFSVIRREWRWLAGLRPLPGAILALVLVSPWFIAIMIETGGRFLHDSVGRDMMAKVATGKESHGAPPLTYFGAFFATFWPFAPLALVAAPWVWRNRARPAVLFLLCWLVPGWLLFELVPTKLPHYVLPLYPAIAILIASAIDEDGLSRGRWAPLALLLMPLLAIAAGVAAVVAIHRLEGPTDWLVLQFAATAGLAAILAWALLAWRNFDAGILVSLVSAVLLYWGIYWAGMPSLPSLWPSLRLADAAHSMECRDPAYATTTFREPSLVFLVGTDVVLTKPAGAADFLAGGPCRMAFVPADQEAEFRARLVEDGIKARLVTRVGGINTNGGKRLDLGVYRTRD